MVACVGKGKTPSLFIAPVSSGVSGSVGSAGTTHLHLYRWRAGARRGGGGNGSHTQLPTYGRVVAGGRGGLSAPEPEA